MCNVVIHSLPLSTHTNFFSFLALYCSALISGHRRPTDLFYIGAGEGAPLFSKGRRWPQMRELEQAWEYLL